MALRITSVHSALPAVDFFANALASGTGSRHLQCEFPICSRIRAGCDHWGYAIDCGWYFCRSASAFDSLDHPIDWIGLPSALRLVFVANRSTYRFEKSAALSDWRRNWNFSRWLLAARLMSMGGFLIMPWLVAWQLGDKATGAFSVCNSLIGFSLMFIVGANNFFQPKTYREYRRSGTNGMKPGYSGIDRFGWRSLDRRHVRLYFWGGQSWGWIYGQGYADAGSVVFVLSLFSLTMCVSIAVSNGLSALEKPHLYLWGEGAFLLATLCSAWFLMPSMGLLGAAVALVIGGVVVSIANIALLTISVRQIDHVAGQAIPGMGDPV